MNPETDLETEVDLQKVLKKIVIITERVQSLKIFTKDDEKISNKLLEEADYYINQLNIELIENPNRSKISEKYKKKIKNKKKFFENALDQKIKKENKFDISKNKDFLNKREELKNAEKYVLEISEKIYCDDLKFKKLNDRVF